MMDRFDRLERLIVSDRCGRTETDTSGGAHMTTKNNRASARVLRLLLAAALIGGVALVAALAGSGDAGAAASSHNFATAFVTTTPTPTTIPLPKPPVPLPPVPLPPVPPKPIPFPPVPAPPLPPIPAPPIPPIPAPPIPGPPAPVPLPPGECGDLAIIAPTGPVEIGQTIPVTLVFDGCDVAWGLPQYKLSVDDPFGGETLTATPGGSTTTATFSATASSAGIAIFNASVSFERAFVDDEGNEFFGFASASAVPIAVEVGGSLAERLGKAEALFSTANPDGGSYLIGYDVICFCIRIPQIEVLVKKGIVVSATDTTGGPANEIYVRTVSDMFNEIADALENAASVSAEFDPDTGVPIRYSIDPDAMIADEEINIVVTSYVPTDQGPDPAEELAKNRDLWNAAGPESYSISYDRFCFCVPFLPTTSWVYDGQSYEAKTNDGDNSDLADAILTVEDAFAVIEKALNNGADSVDVTYDEEYGLPVTISIDFIELAVDDEITYQLRTFVADDNLAFELYSAAIAEEAQGAPGDQYSMIYRRECTFSEFCNRGEAVREAIEVDVRRGPSGLFGVTGFRPEFTRHPILTLTDMLEQEWIEALDRATSWAAQGFPVGVKADYSEELYLTSYTLKAELPRTGAQSLSVTVDEIGEFGCCTDVGATVIYTEDFEDGTDWTLGPDTASTGQWGATAPEATQWFGRPLQQGAASEGTQALVTDGRGSPNWWNVGAYDIDGGEVVATSPPISVPVNVAPASYAVSFDYYFAHLNNATDADYMIVEILPAGGPAVVVVEERGDRTYRSNEWKSIEFDISNFQGQQIEIRVRAADLQSGSLVEAGFDNVQITTENLPLPTRQVGD